MDLVGVQTGIDFEHSLQEKIGKGYTMNIRDTAKVQRKNQLFRNCALVLRYVTRELLYSLIKII